MRLIRARVVSHVRGGCGRGAVAFGVSAGIAGGSGAWLRASGRFRGCAVVAGAARSYLRAALRYDLAWKGTTARRTVRPRAKGYDRAQKGTTARGSRREAVPDDRSGSGCAWTVRTRIQRISLRVASTNRFPARSPAKGAGSRLIHLRQCRQGPAPAMGRGTSGGRWWRRRCPAPAVRRGNGSSFTSHSGPMGLSAEGQRRRPGADEGEPGRSGRQECEFCGAIPVMAFGEGSVGQGREQMVDQRADVECCRGGRQGQGILDLGAEPDRSRAGTRPISSRNPTDLDEGVAPGPAPGRCWPSSVRRGRATR